MRILNPTVLMLGISSSVDASSSFNPQRSALSLVSVGGKAIGSGIAEASKIAAAYGPVVAQKAEELSESTKNNVVNAAKWSYDNPVLATCVVAGGAGVVLVAAPGVVSAPLLSTAGFTASGVQAGSAGAAVHVTIGNVAAGSSFAILQSAGAGGAAALGAVNGIIQTSGAAVVASSAGLAYFKSKL